MNETESVSDRGRSFWRTECDCNKAKEDGDNHRSMIKACGSRVKLEELNSWLPLLLK